MGYVLFDINSKKVTPCEAVALYKDTEGSMQCLFFNTEINCVQIPFPSLNKLYNFPVHQPLNQE